MFVKCTCCGLYCDHPSNLCSICRDKPYVRSKFCTCDKNYLGEPHREGCAGDSEQEYQAKRYTDFVRATMNVLPRYGIPMPNGVDPYLERLVLDVKADGSKTYLHVIYGSDGDRDPHDHPYDFESTILHGSYEEHSFTRSCEACLVDFHHDAMECPHCKAPLSCAELKAPKVFAAGDVNSKKAHELHRLTLVGGPVVTLVRRGPKIRSWGFQTQEGWAHHKPYIAEKFPGALPTEVD